MAATWRPRRYGRKPFLTNGLMVMAVGVGGIGMCTSLSELMQCRLVTGMGVALLTNASTLYVSDIRWASRSRTHPLSG